MKKFITAFYLAKRYQQKLYWDSNIKKYLCMDFFMKDKTLYFIIDFEVITNERPDDRAAFYQANYR